MLIDHPKIVELIENSAYLQGRLINEAGVEFKVISHYFKPGLLLYSTKGMPEEEIISRTEQICFKSVFRYSISSHSKEEEEAHLALIQHFAEVCRHRLHELGESFNIKLEYAPKIAAVLGHDVPKCFKSDLRRSLDKLLDEVVVASLSLPNYLAPSCCERLIKEGFSCSIIHHKVFLVSTPPVMSSPLFADALAELRASTDDQVSKLEISYTHYSDRMARRVQKSLVSSSMVGSTTLNRQIEIVSVDLNQIDNERLCAILRLLDECRQFK